MCSKSEKTAAKSPERSLATGKIILVDSCQLRIPHAEQHLPTTSDVEISLRIPHDKFKEALSVFGIDHTAYCKSLCSVRRECLLAFLVTVCSTVTC